MKNNFILLVLLILSSCSTSKKVVSTIKGDPENLVGIVDKDSFLNEPYNTWFSPNYEDYTLDTLILEKLKPHLKNVTIKAFMGTWCGDSQEQIPVFYKILNDAKFKYSNLELIAVNRGKTTPNNLQEGFNIIRVPTFIFFKEGKEIGRFVEFPQESVEADMLKIISGAPYKHSYED